MRENNDNLKTKKQEVSELTLSENFDPNLV